MYSNKFERGNNHRCKKRPNENLKKTLKNVLKNVTKIKKFVNVE